MSTKTITIMEDAYKVLRREKHPGESFTEVILRRFGGKPKGSLMECFGTWKMSKEEWKEIKADEASKLKAIRGKEVFKFLGRLA